MKHFNSRAAAFGTGFLCIAINTALSALPAFAKSFDPTIGQNRKQLNWHNSIKSPKAGLKVRMGNHHHWTDSPPPTNPPPPPTSSINVMLFGAKGDGVTDDQTAITKALASAKSSNSALYFPAGNYVHSGVLVVDSVTMYGAGSSTLLTATDGSNGAVELTGASPSLSSLVVQYASSNTYTPQFPDSTPQMSAVWVQSANNFAVNQITINNASENSLDLLQSSNGMISNNQLQDNSSMFDDLQIVDSSNVQVSNNIFTHNGQGAAIDFVDSSTGSQNINVQSNTLILTSASFFGIVATGIQSSVIQNNTVNGGGQCQLIITSDPTNFVRSKKMFIANPGGPVNNLQVIGNTFNNSSSDAVEMYGTQCTNIQLTSNKITNVNDTAIYIDPNVANITISSNVINTCYIGIDSNCGNNITVQGNTLSNASFWGIYFFAEFVAGFTTIDQNTLSNCCITGGNVIEVDDVPSTFTALAITNNTYNGPANSAGDFIVCQVGSSSTSRTISGNTQTSTTLPNSIAP